MREALRDAILGAALPAPMTVLVRLIAAMVLGALVALVYRRTRPALSIAPTFTATLVLLAILIAMVTQVIGDNVARAFSLVGALSIVRFRTIVRDTQDTAYVIFAVGVGMAAGAGQYGVGIIGIAVVAVAAAAMKNKAATSPSAGAAFELHVRLGIGHDPQVLLGPVLAEHAHEWQMMSISTARQGLAIEVVYRVIARDDLSPDALVRALNAIEGVQSITFRRDTTVEDDGPGRTL
jgi:hypothetical protein